jgi:hypothetical protein
MSPTRIGRWPTLVLTAAVIAALGAACKPAAAPE